MNEKPVRINNGRPASRSNREVAAHIGLTDGGVSRIRSGSRLPNDETIQKIAEVYGWTVADQAVARVDGTYTEKFCRIVCNDPDQPQ